MIIHNFDPILIDLGFFQIRWYSLAYIMGILLGWYLAKKLFINDKNKIIKIKPIKVEHGSVESICYILGNKLAYISDVSKIFKKDFRYFKNLNYLIIDCLWYRYHPSHFNLEKSLEMIKIFKPKKAILTNLHTDIDYKEIKKKLPKNVTPAYDGLTLTL